MAPDLRLVARRVAAGDTQAFRAIVDHTQARLFRLASRLVGDLSEAEDVLQEAYVKAFRALRAGRFDERAKVTTWLYRVVTNASLDAMRRRRERPSEAAHEAAVDGVPETEARVALRRLNAWLDELPPQQRAVLVLRAVEGMTTPEVARVLACSEGAVEQRLVRARATLRARREQAERGDDERR